MAIVPDPLLITIFAPEDTRAAVATQRQIRPDGGSFHRWQRRKPLDQSLSEPDLCARVVVALRKCDPGQQQARTNEARINRGALSEAPDHQTGPMRKAK